MAGTVIFLVLMVFYAIYGMGYVSALPKDLLFPTGDGNSVEISKSIAYPLSANNQHLKMFETEEKPKNCFHFFVSRNMSSLLADATKMLRTIRDRREREWILTFIYRIKSLAEHIRSHPESQNYDCLPSDDEMMKRILSDGIKGQQPELYFVDDIPNRSSEVIPSEKVEKKSRDNHDLIHSFIEQSAPNIPLQHETKSKMGDTASEASSSMPQTKSSAEMSSSPEENNPSGSSEAKKDTSLSDKQNTDESHQSQDTIQTEWKNYQSEMDDDDNSLIRSSEPDCDYEVECRKKALSSENSPESYFADGGIIYPAYPEENTEQDFVDEMYQQEVLKRRIRKALLEELSPEIKKLQTVGGTPEDLMALWDSFTAQVDKRMKESHPNFDYEETGAAAGDLNMNEKYQPERTVAPSLVEVRNSKGNSNTKESYEPYDDSDVLVQQLFEVRYNDSPSKTTKSLSDQNNEYSITSTPNPL